jgi:hypothetical protein
VLFGILKNPEQLSSTVAKDGPRNTPLRFLKKTFIGRLTIGLARLLSAYHSAVVTDTFQEVDLTSVLFSLLLKKKRLK